MGDEHHGIYTFSNVEAVEKQHSLFVSGTEQYIVEDIEFESESFQLVFDKRALPYDFLYAPIEGYEFEPLTDTLKIERILYYDKFIKFYNENKTHFLQAP